MKRIMVAMLLLLILGGFFTVSIFASGQNNTDKTEETTEIRVWMWGEVIAPGMNDWYKESAKLYQEKNPNVLVIPTEIPLDDIQQAWTAAAAAGDLPEICLMGRQQGIDAAKAGEILPIDKFWSEEEIGNLYVSAQQELGWDGHVWMVPEYMEAWGMVYNKKIFAEVGLDAPPKTWVEFMEMAEKIKSFGYTPMSIGWKDGYQSPWFFNTVAIQSLNSASDLHKAVLGEQHFTDPNHADWWNIIEEARDKGYFNKDAASIGLGEGLDLFYTGNIAMGLVVQPVAAAYVAEMGEDVIGAMKTPFPAIAGDTAGKIPITPMALALSNTKNAEIAADFLRFLLTKERVNALYETSGALQASKLFDLDSAKTDLDKQFVEWMNEGTTFNYNSHYPPIMDSEGYGIGQLLIAGVIDAKEAAQMMEDVAVKWRKDDPEALEAFKKTSADWESMANAVE
jgi:raffinose/stachyose/melibiose transport system substrate-binding protein